MITQIYIDDELCTYGITAGSLSLEEILLTNELNFGELNTTKFEVQLFNTANADLTGKSIRVDADGETIFTGYIDEAKYDRTRFYRDIVAYDISYKLRDYEVIYWWNQYWTNKTTTSLNDLRQSLLTYVGITEDSTTMPVYNSDLAIPKYTAGELTTLKFADIFKMICELQHVIPHVSRTGQMQYWGNFSHSVSLGAWTSGSMIDSITGESIGADEWKSTDYIDISQTVGLLTFSTLTPIKITEQPVNQTVAAGDTVTFHVGAVGEGLTYQWQYSTAALESWTNFGSPSTGSTLTRSAQETWNGYKVRCRVRDASGATVYSNAVSIAINTASLFITEQPQTYIGELGDTATFHVSVSATSLYQWEWKSATSSRWITYVGTGSHTDTISIEITPETAGNMYRCLLMTPSGSVFLITDFVSIQLLHNSSRQTSGAFYDNNRTPLGTFDIEETYVDLPQNAKYMRLSALSVTNITCSSALSTASVVHTGLHVEGSECEFSEFATHTIDTLSIYDEAASLIYTFGVQNNPYVIKGNLLLLAMTEAQINTVCNNLLTAISTIKYSPASIKLVIGDKSIRVGDYIIADELVAPMIVFQNTLSGSQLVEQTVASTANGVYREKQTPSSYDGLAIVKSTVDKSNSARDEVIQHLVEQVADASGLYLTTELQADGSTKYIFHDKPSILESSLRLTMSAGGIELYNNGQIMSGFDFATATAFLNNIYTIGLNADYITTGLLSDPAGNYSLDMATGTVNMKNANITGGTINIETASDTIDVIKLSYKNTSSSLKIDKVLTLLSSGIVLTSNLVGNGVTTNTSTTIVGSGITVKNEKTNAEVSLAPNSITFNNGSNANSLNYESVRALLNSKAVFTGSRTKGCLKFPEAGIKIQFGEVSYSGSIASPWGSIYETASAISLGDYYEVFSSSSPMVTYSLSPGSATDVWVSAYGTDSTTHPSTVYLERGTALAESRTYYIKYIAIGLA